MPETTIYATDKPLEEITEDDLFLDAVVQAVIKEGKVYHFIDEREPMFLSEDTWYAEIYAKAVETLSKSPSQTKRKSYVRKTSKFIGCVAGYPKGKIRR